MTTEEFSNEFDTLVSSYRRFKNFDNQEYLDSIEFDEYEKSQFLTYAQEELVSDLYSGKNTDGFEGTEQLRRYLDTLVKYKDITLSNYKIATFVPQDDLKYYAVSLNDIEETKNLMAITYEAVSFNDVNMGCKNHKTGKVIPIKQDELTNIVKNPFRGPNTSRVIRVDVGKKQVELISQYELDKYYIGFIERPAPIILSSLGNLTINGVSTIQTCALDEMLHRVILKRAVQLALSSKLYASNNNEKV